MHLYSYVYGDDAELLADALKLTGEGRSDFIKRERTERLELVFDSLSRDFERQVNFCD